MLRRDFKEGVMNKDLDERLLPPGQYRHAENIIISDSEQNDAGAVKDSFSTIKLSGLDYGLNPHTVTPNIIRDSYANRFYWFIVSDNGCYVIEWDKQTNISTFVLQDTRVGDENILGFDKDVLITGVNIVINSDNGDRFLSWTCNRRGPRIINIERAKTYAINGFGDADITVIKAPPLYPPIINLSNTPTSVENNIEERFLRFAYQYQYLDNEFSAFSPFTEVAFRPSSGFNYNYNTGENNSMVNLFNQVDIEFNTGSNIVKAVRILFKDSSSNNVNVVHKYIKSDEGWIDNDDVQIQFTNNKIYKILPESQLERLYDNVPRYAKSQLMIGNRLFYGNYTENYDLKDCDGNNVDVDFSVSLISNEITIGNVYPTLKSIRDYEIGISYVDIYGRMTTVLDSNNNAITIPISESFNQNVIKVTIPKSLIAPCFAEKFRFFIKQNKTHYHTIIPSLFYEDDQYRWFKLDNADKDKIKEGDYLIVKADSQSIQTSLIKAKVLEIIYQEKNFLQPEDVIDEIINKAGLYFKLLPKNFQINEADYYNFNLVVSNYNSSNQSGVVQPTDIVYDPVFYGTVLDDMTIGATTSTSISIPTIGGYRYIIRISSTGPIDQFEWSSDNGITFSTPQDIVSGEVLLQHGIYIEFGAVTGHSLVDEWNFYVHSDLSSSINSSFGFFRTVGGINETMGTDYSLLDEIIESGGNIDISNIEYSQIGNAEINASFTSSSKYKNIMEWFYREGIKEQLEEEVSFNMNPGSNPPSPVSLDIGFVRCKISDVSGGNTLAEYDSDGFMTMYIRNQLLANSTSTINSQRSETTIFQQGESPVVFETDTKDENLDIFNEIGRTYDIQDGAHKGYNSENTDDVDQEIGVTDGEYILPAFNCFSWGNGVESYRVKDSIVGNNFSLNTRQSSTIDDYKKNVRIASWTYSQAYDQSLNLNGLNEFNLSLVNWKDLDDQYGSIQHGHPEDTNICSFQEDKIFIIPVSKDVLFDAGGNGVMRESNDILGTEIPVTGEYGISRNPESFAFFGNRKYFTDVDRGVVLRMSADGLTVISDKGLKKWFKDVFRRYPNTKKIGAYDSRYGYYTLHIDNNNIKGLTIVPIGTRINVYESESVVEYSAQVDEGSGDLLLNYDTDNTINIIVDEDGVIHHTGDVTGVGTLTIKKNSSDTTNLGVKVIPISNKPSYSIVIPSMTAEVPNVVANDNTIEITEVEQYDINVLYNDSFQNPVEVTIIDQSTKGIITVNSNNTLKYVHDGVSSGVDSFKYQIDDGNTTDIAVVTLNINSRVDGSGAQALPFSISSESYFSSSNKGQEACIFLLDVIKYHNGLQLYPQVGGIIYDDIDKENPTNGYNKYYAIKNGMSIKIGSNGEVLDRWYCEPFSEETNQTITVDTDSETVDTNSITVDNG